MRVAVHRRLTYGRIGPNRDPHHLLAKQGSLEIVFVRDDALRLDRDDIRSIELAVAGGFGLQLPEDVGLAVLIPPLLG